MVQERVGLLGYFCSQVLGFSGFVGEWIFVGLFVIYFWLFGSVLGNEVKNFKIEVLLRCQDGFFRVFKYFGDEELYGGSDYKQDLVNNGCVSSNVSKLRLNSFCVSSSYIGSGFEDNDELYEVEDDWEFVFDVLYVQSLLY